MTNHTRTLRTGWLAALALLPLMAGAPRFAAARPGPDPVITQDIPSPPLLEVTIANDGDQARLRALDLDLIELRFGVSARLLGWPGAREALSRAGFAVRVVSEDYGAELARRNGPFSRSRAPRPGGLTSVPAPGQGGLAGFYTLEEIEQFLADLHANDPHGIVGPVTTIGMSRQGRPIHAVRIASPLFPDHSRPRVLYTSLTHAREPIGMQSVIEFMTRLVEGYGTDPDLTYLVNRREMWFVPCVNPDGYVINQAKWTGSGVYGMWRKNARDNDTNGRIDSHDGVDLNRNYGYRWGYNTAGSSTDPNSDTYRGTAAFSEPETQAIRDFAVAHQFTTAVHYHAFGELCLNPWGYNGMATPDGAVFNRLAEDLCRDVDYEKGVATELLYPVNGGACDWFYGEQTTKPKCFAFVEEVGDQNDQFWPAPERIPVLARLQFRSNVVLGYAAGAFALPESASVVSGDGFLHPGGEADVALTIRNGGQLPTGAPITGAVESLTPGVSVLDPVSTFSALDPGAVTGPTGGDFIRLKASASLDNGALVRLLVTLTTDGSYFYADTVEFVSGAPIVAFADDASQGTGNWTISSRWGVETVNGNPVFSDSPGAQYTTSALAILTKSAPIDLSGADHAWLRFRTWYKVDVGGDAGRVEISSDGGATWTAVRGRYTHPGHGMTGAYALGTQGADEPVYDGVRIFPADEEMDLSAYAGLTDVRLRFRFTSDETLRNEGWFVDDVRVLVYPASTSGVPADGTVAARPVLSPATPNPFSGGTRLTATFPGPTVFTAAVFSVDGRLVRSLADGIAQAGARDLYWDGRTDDGRTAASGTYFVRVVSGPTALTQRVVRIR